MISMSQTYSIRQLRKSGESISEIARKVGVSRNTVYAKLAAPDLPPDVLQCVNIALVCNRLEELVYGPDPCPKQEALEAIRAETQEGYWPEEEAELLARLLGN